MLHGRSATAALKCVLSRKISERERADKAAVVLQPCSFATCARLGMSVAPELVINPNEIEVSAASRPSSKPSSLVLRGPSAGPVAMQLQEIPAIDSAQFDSTAEGGQGRSTGTRAIRGLNRAAERHRIDFSRIRERPRPVSPPRVRQSGGQCTRGRARLPTSRTGAGGIAGAAPSSARSGYSARRRAGRVRETCRDSPQTPSP